MVIQTRSYLNRKRIPRGKKWKGGNALTNVHRCIDLLAFQPRCQVAIFGKTGISARLCNVRHNVRSAALILHTRGKLGWCCNTTVTSLDEGARGTNTQIWSTKNWIHTIARVLPSSSDDPVLLLNQPCVSPPRLQPWPQLNQKDVLMSQGALWTACDDFALKWTDTQLYWSVWQIKNHFPSWPELSDFKAIDAACNNTVQNQIIAVAG